MTTAGLDPRSDPALEAALVAAPVSGLGDMRLAAAPLPVGPYDVALGPSDSLGATFAIWAKNLGRLALLGFLPFVVVIPGLVGAAVFFALSNNAWADADLLAAVVVGTVVVCLAGVLSLASAAAMFLVVDEKERGGDITAGAALLAGLRHVGWLFVASVATGAVALLAFGAPLLPVILGLSLDEPWLALGAIPALAASLAGGWVLARVLPWMPVIVIEDKNAIAALQRAWSLTEGRGARVLGAALLFGGTWMGASMALGVVGIVPLLGMLVQLAGNVVLTPLVYVFPFVVYAGAVQEQQGGNTSGENHALRPPGPRGRWPSSLPGP